MVSCGLIYQTSQSYFFGIVVSLNISNCLCLVPEGLFLYVEVSIGTYLYDMT